MPPSRLRRAAARWSVVFLVSLLLVASARPVRCEAPVFLGEWAVADVDPLLPVSEIAAADSIVFVVLHSGVNYIPSSLRKYSADGNRLTSIPGPSPIGCARTDAVGDLYVAYTTGSALTAGGGVIAYSREGAMLWSVSCSAYPTGVAVSPTGDLYVGEVTSTFSATKFSRITRFSSSGAQLGTVLTGPMEDSYVPYGCDVDGNVYAGMHVNGQRQIRRYSPAGTYLGTWGTVGAGPLAGVDLRRMTVDRAGRIFVLDGGCRVLELDAAGSLLGAWGSCGVAPGQFTDAQDLSVDGRIYVLDSAKRVLMFGDPSMSAVRMGWGDLKAIYR